MKKLGFVLIVILSSCSTSKVVYVKGNDWKPMPKKSQITGWTYVKNK